MVATLSFKQIKGPTDRLSPFLMTPTYPLKVTAAEFGGRVGRPLKDFSPTSSPCPRHTERWLCRRTHLSPPPGKSASGFIVPGRQISLVIERNA